VILSSEESDDDRVKRGLRDAEALLHVLKPLTEAVWAGDPRLKLVQSLALAECRWL
jgi:phosphoglycerate dehydrogenase-like enzyme